MFSVLSDISAHSLHQNKGKTLGYPFICIKYIIYDDVMSSKAIINHQARQTEFCSYIVYVLFA